MVSPEEYSPPLTHYPGHLKPIVKLACRTGMGQGEVRGLTWGQVDLRKSFMHLRPEDCKTIEGRDVPLPPEVIEALRALPRGRPGVKVSTY
jgi:integrase